MAGVADGREVGPQMLNLKTNRGQGLVEYALILVFVAIVVIVVLVILGPSVGNMYSNIVSGI
jgi:pilus assembly protein Flp/PilA